MRKTLSPKAVARKARKKRKATQLREQKDTEIAKYLEEKGWARGDNDPNVWVIALYNQHNLAYRTLRQAYKMQLKIDSYASKDD